MFDLDENDPAVQGADPALRKLLRRGQYPSHAKLLPEGYEFAIDTREQKPWAFEPAVRKGLPTGDYSITGMEDLIVVERKSLPDLLGVMASGRDRFERELERMRGYERALLVVEKSWEDIARGEYYTVGGDRIRMSRNSVLGTLRAWILRYRIMLFCAPTRGAAQEWVRDLLVKAAHDHQKGKFPWADGRSGSPSSTSSSSSIDSEST